MTLPREWADQGAEEAIEPDLPICDPHHHFWTGRGGKFLRDPDYLLAELVADTGSGHNIVSTVFIECRSMYRADGPVALRPVGETEFVNGLAAMSASGQFGPTRAAAGIVSHADLTLGEGAREVLEAHIAAGGGRFRGIRHSAGWDASPDVEDSFTDPGEGLYLREDFRRGFSHLAPLGLVFDAWLYHPQLDDLIDLARAFPQTTIVMNHLGGLLGTGPYAGRREEIFVWWKDKMAEVAACPNVVVKTGGLQMPRCGFGWHERERPPTSVELSRAIARYCHHAIKVFGADRAMFESNFPVDRASCSYSTLWNAFKRVASGYCAQDKARLFHDTAVRIYRLEGAGSGGT